MITRVKHLFIVSECYEAVFVQIPEDIDTQTHVSLHVGVLVETRRSLAIKVYPLQITHTRARDGYAYT